MQSLLLATMSLQATAHAFTSCTQTFSFPSIPMDMGIRHIHTPESYAKSHQLTMPSFQLIRVHEPYMLGTYAVIHFHFQTLFGMRTACMFTNDRCVSNVLMSEDNDSRPSVLTIFKVAREGMFGHTVRIQSETMFLCNPKTKTLPSLSTHIIGFGPVLVTEEHITDAIREGYHTKNENANFLTYRRMVLFGEGMVLKE